MKECIDYLFQNIKQEDCVSFVFWKRKIKKKEVKMRKVIRQSLRDINKWNHMTKIRPVLLASSQ